MKYASLVVMFKTRYLYGGQIIKVKGLTQSPKSDRTWTYAWYGEKELEVGDELVLTIHYGKQSSREWEVVVVELGSDYTGEVAKIGGMYGLAYPAITQD